MKRERRENVGSGRYSSCPVEDQRPALWFAILVLYDQRLISLSNSLCRSYLPMWDSFFFGFLSSFLPSLSLSLNQLNPLSLHPSFFLTSLFPLPPFLLFVFSLPIPSFPDFSPHPSPFFPRLPFRRSIFSSSFPTLFFSSLFFPWIYSSGLRLAQLTNKCTGGEEDLEYFIAESGEHLSTLPSRLSAYLSVLCPNELKYSIHSIL